MTQSRHRLLCGLTFALFLSPVCNGIAQVPRALSAAAFSGLAELERACAGLPCIVTVTTPQTITLQSPHTLPPNIALDFRASALWTVNGSTLTLPGTVTGPQAAQIFAGTGHIAGMHTARPEWFVPASSDPAGLPPEALRLAYDSTVPGATILLNDATYVSPFFNPAQGNCEGATGLTSPRIFRGTTRPAIDSEANPRQLLNGTILRGEICSIAEIELHHLGLDAGALVMHQLFHDHKSFGLVLTQDRRKAQAAQSALEDVAVLANDAKDQHAVILEGLDHVLIDHLWIWAPGATHGLVLKSSHVAVHDFHCTGAFSDCLIIKSDWDTDSLGYAEDVAVDQVDIHQLHQPGDTGGILIDARRDNVVRIQLTHVAEQGTIYGLSDIASPFYEARNLTLADWQVSTPGPCIYTEKAATMEVRDFHCTVLASTDPPEHPGLLTLQGRAMNLNNIAVHCNSPSCSTTPAIALGAPGSLIASVQTSNPAAPPLCLLSGTDPPRTITPTATPPACHITTTWRAALRSHYAEAKTNLHILLLRTHTRFRRSFSTQ